MPDVVVVGAGAAGLACATDLQQAGARVLIVEARDRVGGRIRSLRTASGDLVEVGAQVVHGEAPQTVAVADRARLGMAPIGTDEDVAVVVRGRRLNVADVARTLRPPPWVVEAALPKADAPGTAAAALATLDPVTRAVATAWVEQAWGADTAVLDRAAMAVARRGRPGGEARALVDGYDGVAAALAAPLDVRQGFPVQRLDWRPGRARVSGPGGDLEADAVVLTPPPHVVADLAVTPRLPDGKRSAAAVLRSSDGLVVVVVLRRPARESTWTLLVDAPGGLWRRVRGSRVLVGHLKGNAAGAGRRQPWDGVALDDVLALLGERDDVDGVQIVDWGRDPWARGTYSAPVAGAAVAGEAWAEPVEDTLFFAGEASSEPHVAGLVEGALTSGRRAAAQVLARRPPAG